MTSGRHRPVSAPPAAPQATAELVSAYRSPWWLPRLCFLAAAAAFALGGAGLEGHEVWLRSPWGWLAYGAAAFAAGWAVP